MNVVAICGTEPCPDSLKYSDTFMNNMRTWRKEHKEDKLVIYDARDFITAADPLRFLWRNVKESFPSIDLVIYSGHSSPLNLLVFYHARTNLPNDMRYIGGDFEWDMPLSENATIILLGCQTVGTKGVKNPNSIAQKIANTTKRHVFGYTWRSSQKLINGGYYQLPERGGLVEVTPTVV